MSEQKMKRELLQWHAVFYAGLQIELEEEADKLIFENEHQLGTKPMEVDVLIIKKDSEYSVRKNIGRIFRKYNIIEYKSPSDYVSIDDFYKVYGYGCFYKADTVQVDAIKADDLTISFISPRYPRKLINHLRKKRKYEVVCVEKGIYHIRGDYIPMQIIVTNDLAEEENLWLKNLTDRISEKSTAEKLLEAYKGKEKNPLYESVMDMIVRANEEIFKEENGMCRALRELMKDEIEAEVKEQVKLAEKRAKKSGEESGINRVNNLILKLSQKGRVDDIIKAASDKTYQEQLLLEFGL